MMHKIVVTVLAEDSVQGQDYQLWLDQELMCHRTWTWPPAEIGIHEIMLVDLAPGHHAIKVTGPGFCITETKVNDVDIPGSVDHVSFNVVN